MSFAHPALVRAGPRADVHVVDALIAERAPRLAASAAWPALRPLLHGLLGYPAARRLADALAPLRGTAVLAEVSARLRLKTTAQGLGHLPADGPVIVACNHPTGIADGVAVFDALTARRTDLTFYANADALRVAPGLAEVVIPVEWVAARRSREKTRRVLARTRAALDAGRSLVIFPSGRLARRATDGVIADPPWTASAVSLARSLSVPLLPLHLAGPWPRLFHLFDGWSDELRDITLFHELLATRGRRYALTAGPLIPPDRLAGDLAAVTARLQAYVERRLPGRPEEAFA